MTVKIMENANIDESELDVTTISDVELAKKLRELGANIGPVTHSTRSVYQRKLERWLKYGSNHSMTIISSPSHSSVEESLPVQDEEISTNESIEIEQLQQIENECTDSPVSKNSDANLCKDASLACNRSAQLECDGKNNKKTLVQQHKNLPVVSQEDIELVDRVMTSTSQSASCKAASYQSFSYQSSASNDISSESFNEEPFLRSRYMAHSVTPRPSLKSYRENLDKNYSGDSITPGRGVFITSSRIEPSIPLTVNSSTKPCSTTARLMMLLVTVVCLVIVAVVYNIEPSYVNRLEH